MFVHIAEAAKLLHTSEKNVYRLKKQNKIQGKKDIIHNATLIQVDSIESYLANSKKIKINVNIKQSFFTRITPEKSFSNSLNTLLVTHILSISNVTKTLEPVRRYNFFTSVKMKIHLTEIAQTYNCTISDVINAVIDTYLT